jgi:hypothetical protein
LLQAQADILKIAKNNQMDNDEFHIAQRSAKHMTEFPINSYVLVNYENEEHKAPSKLHTYLRGPLRVVNYSKNVYTLENLVTRKLEDFHVKLLHPFIFDNTREDPRMIAQHDEDYFEIQQVLTHRFVGERGQKAKASELQLKILWSGYSTADWQSWSPDLAKNIKVHNYLKENQLKRFIPRAFKSNDESEDI